MRPPSRPAPPRWSSLLAGLLVLELAVAAASPPPRLRAVIRAFLVATGYPQGRPGYVVDHKIPLCAGGPDAADNLQWQPRAASYQKDVFERTLCAEMHRQGLRPFERIRP